MGDIAVPTKGQKLEGAFNDKLIKDTVNFNHQESDYDRHTKGEGADKVANSPVVPVEIRK